MHINTRVDDTKAKLVKRIALDLDHEGWPEIIALALDLYIKHFGASAVTRDAEHGRTNSDRAG